MTPERSVGLLRNVVAVTIRHGGMWKNHDVLQLRPDAALRSGPTSSFGRETRSLSDLIGCYPEHETDHRRITLSPVALIGRPVSRPPRYVVGFAQMATEGFMRLRHTAALAIRGNQINPHAP
jgi:hypothetical protein